MLAASQVLVDLHLDLAWVVIVANGLAGVWALAAHRDERFRVKQLWWFTAFAEIAAVGGGKLGEEGLLLHFVLNNYQSGCLWAMVFYRARL